MMQLELKSRWLDEQKQFFIYSDDADPDEWKELVFCWHEETFYGTFATVDTIGNHIGVLLSPWEALTFFAYPSTSAFIDTIWDEQSKQFQIWAKQIIADIEQKQFMPDFDAWKQGWFGWKRTTEDEHPFISVWRSEAINDWIQLDVELKQTWQQIAETYPILTSDSASFMDEHDWLTEIGWDKNRPPFIVAIRLNEPEEDGKAWSLETVLIDATTNDFTVYPHMPKAWEAYVSHIERAQQRWQTIVPWLSENDTLRTQLNEEEAWRFLVEATTELTEAGVRVIVPEWWEIVKQTKLRVKARVKSSATSVFGLDALVDFDWRIATNGIELTEQQFAELVEQKRRLVRIRDQWVQLDPAVIQHVQKLMKQAKQEGLSIRDVLMQTLAEKTNEQHEDDEAIDIELNRSFATLVRKMKNIDHIQTVTVPTTFHGTLRPYQQRGVDWLIFLRQLGFGGCLADDMGLGKTVQMLAYLAYVKENEKRNGPALLICPTSVIGNWQKECQQFVPSLRVYVHHGQARAKEEAFFAAVNEADVVITSYSLAHLDFDDLSNIAWDVICLDEAQNIKNAQTKQARAIRKLKGRHKIALTGTPIENRLNELWSIFQFLNPGYLGSQTDFQRRFGTPIEKNGDAQATEKLQKLIRPFLLRRTKTDERIALDLPDKLEQKEYCPLTVEQASLYEQIVQQSLEKLEQVDGLARRGIILQMLNSLKQLCNHPALYLKEKEPKQIVERSHKVEKLLELVEQIRENGESCLVFTQYIQMGEMMQYLLSTHLKENVVFLNGSTPKQTRDDMIEQFQNGQFHIFILSLKAGGTGLNLTAANHVIHFDRWWNPAVENQATDRAYRIGQTKFVHVHKLITTGTIEEKIDDMLEKKQALNEQLIQSETWITELSNEQLRELFTLS
ncbi:DEAD/DEAH box helicase [Anoxybacillus suryakundensis]|uniref:Superfamily II DNA or RNA helicase, SNF2 family n=2 Tax=Anoxybacillus suryakundensis TaxID=1325335 RepID=A0A0K6GPY7_9BACL|nr:Superfamily II DNA or RNA helicase, SNF2 family [Anoxybacillus suryakundensis]